MKLKSFLWFFASFSLLLPLRAEKPEPIKYPYRKILIKKLRKRKTHSRLRTLLPPDPDAAPKIVEPVRKNDKETVSIGVREPFNVRCIDPHLATTVHELQIVVNLFEGLVVSKGYEVSPGLAKRWEVSEDRKSWTFYLREDAKWSDGKPVTSDDFVFGWKRALTEETYKKTPTILKHRRDWFKRFPIEGSNNILGFQKRMKKQTILKETPFDVYEEEVISGEEEIPPEKAIKPPMSQLAVWAEGPTVLRFTLERPIDPRLVLHYLTEPVFYPLRKTYVDNLSQAQEASPERLPCCGAFTLTCYRPPSSIELSKNPHYWSVDSLKLNKVSFIANPDLKRLQEFWETGKIDFYEINNERLNYHDDEYTLNQRAHFFKLKGMTLQGVALDLANSSLKKKVVRESLNRLVDRKRIRRNLNFPDTVHDIYGLLPTDPRCPCGFDKLGTAPWSRMSRDMITANVKEIFNEAGYNYSYGILLYLSIPEEKAMLVREVNAGFNTYSGLSIDCSYTILTVEPKLLKRDEIPETSLWFVEFNFGSSWFDRFAYFRGQPEENPFHFYHKEFNEIMDALESGAIAEGPHGQGAAYYRLDQIIQQELPIISWRVKDRVLILNREIGGLPPAHKPLKDSVHHPSGALYLKELYVGSPDSIKASYEVPRLPVLKPSKGVLPLE